MQTSLTETNKNNNKKIKLDFKESKYATGRRKNLQQEYGLKMDLEKST